jgi:hypothetical protein
MTCVSTAGRPSLRLARWLTSSSSCSSSKWKELWLALLGTAISICRRSVCVRARACVWASVCLCRGVGGGTRGGRRERFQANIAMGARAVAARARARAWAWAAGSARGRRRRGWQRRGLTCASGCSSVCLRTLARRMLTHQ